MKKTSLFFSTKKSGEQDLKNLTLAQLQRLVENDHDDVEMITYDNIDEYLLAKSDLSKRYDFEKVNQILMVISHDKVFFKRKKEVSDVLSR